MRDYKTMIVPIVAALCLAFGTITGHLISSSMESNIETWAYTLFTLGIAIYGIIKDHRKKPMQKVEEIAKDVADDIEKNDKGEGAKG